MLTPPARVHRRHDPDDWQRTDGGVYVPRVPMRGGMVRRGMGFGFEPAGCCCGAPCATCHETVPCCIPDEMILTLDGYQHWGCDYSSVNGIPFTVTRDFWIRWPLISGYQIPTRCAWTHFFDQPFCYDYWIGVGVLIACEENERLIITAGLLYRYDLEDTIGSMGPELHIVEPQPEEPIPDCSIDGLEMQGTIGVSSISVLIEYS